ncbi:MAG: methylmalonyl-CoA carboxyltransferase [Acetobacteraceae bacterium]|nr:methylmalonyl-CoA carboxyltransferase [Acetobacteraceae bacterium]
MAQEDRLEELARREARVRAGGGEDKVRKQHEAGKLCARERLDRLFDPGSFVELDRFVTHRCTEFGMDRVEAPGEGVVTGYGRVAGRLCFAYAQDFTVIGGSLGEMHAAKICKVLDLAVKTGAPVVGLNDSGGARIQEGVLALNGYGQIFYRNTLASGVIPQISVIMGPCAGGAVYSPALTDFVFMVAGTAQMFITGPQVIKAVTGEEVSLEQLGGAQTHNRVSGVAHFIAQGEDECLAQVRRLLQFLPSNNLEDPPRLTPSDPPDRRAPGLRTVIPEDPNKPYDVRDVLTPVLDAGDLMEVHPLYATNAVVGFGRLAGIPVGVVANQPATLAGCLDINASDKIARFVRFCDAFNLPLVTWVDTPGYLPGTAQEYGGIIRHGAKVLYAYSEATVPKVTVVLRKAYGGAYLAMCARSLGADRVLAWPSAEIAVMGPEGAANIIFRDEIAAAPDPAAARREYIQEYRAKFANPYVAAAVGFVDSVIDPQETRPRVIEALLALLGKREDRPAKKHGNIPA